MAGRTARPPTRDAVFGLAVFAVTLGLLLVRFLVPRPIGVSNNGDGARVLCGAGIPWKGGPESYVHLFYGAPAGACQQTYVLSQVWLTQIARWLGEVAGLQSTLSLVVLGLLGSVIAAAAVTLIVLGLPYSRRVRLAAAAALLLVVADSAFFGYFASVLGEGAAFLGILLAAGGLLLTARPGWWGYAGLAVTLVGGFVAVNAKVQTLMILPLLALAVLLVRPATRRGFARWLPALLVVVALAGTTWYAQQTIEPPKSPFGEVSALPGDDSREINMFNTIFLTIVDGKHDTQADLAELGLPASFAQYAGNGWWHAHPATLDPLYLRYRTQITRGNVISYFANHPGRTLGVLDRAAGDLLTARPDYLGSFDQSAGFAPRAQEYRVPVLSSVTKLLAPLGLFALAPLWLLIGWRAWRSRREALGVLLAFLLAVGAGQFVLAALGDGLENIKHQSVALYCTLLALALAGVVWNAKPTEP
ncbi:glycan biosynthesis hexose transferase WsfD [Amycolatopsis sp. H20-H5]|uniref:glycan biosynthesis hexose transferase WsfD n=1 Tax=Amycolatopsis sp. H20-H5 TaxID=3046309 RepID=UPI003FA36508